MLALLSQALESAGGIGNWDYHGRSLSKVFVVFMKLDGSTTGYHCNRAWMRKGYHRNMNEDDGGKRSSDSMDFARKATLANPLELEINHSLSVIIFIRCQ